MHTGHKKQVSQVLHLASNRQDEKLVVGQERLYAMSRCYESEGPKQNDTGSITDACTNDAPTLLLRGTKIHGYKSKTTESHMINISIQHLKMLLTQNPATVQQHSSAEKGSDLLHVKQTICVGVTGKMAATLTRLKAKCFKETHSRRHRRIPNLS